MATSGLTMAALKPFQPRHFRIFPQAQWSLMQKGQIIAPGFIDLHIYGGGGASILDAQVEAVETVLHTHAQYGTTGMLVSTVTAEIPVLLKALSAVDQVAQKKPQRPKVPRYLVYTWKAASWRQNGAVRINWNGYNAPR